MTSTAPAESPARDRRGQRLIENASLRQAIRIPVSARTPLALCYLAWSLSIAVSLRAPRPPERLEVGAAVLSFYAGSLLRNLGRWYRLRRTARGPLAIIERKNHDGAYDPDYRDHQAGL
jgi:hypothetical protein